MQFYVLKKEVSFPHNVPEPQTKKFDKKKHTLYDYLG